MRYLTVKEFALTAGLSTDYVRKQVRLGVLPAFRLRDSGMWRIDTSKLGPKLRAKGHYVRPGSRATACIATLARGHGGASVPVAAAAAARIGAARQYRQLPSDLRARVDAWCLKRGIPSPGLQVNAIPLAPPRPADMTPQGAD